MAYEDFEDRVKLISKKLSAYELVDNAIKYNKENTLRKF